MPTTNPVPSQSPADLPFNAGKLDELVNGAGLTYLTRLGEERMTAAGVEVVFGEQLSSVSASHDQAIMEIIGKVENVEGVVVAAVEAAVEATAESAEIVVSNKNQFEDRIYPGVYSSPPTNKPRSGAPSAEGDRCVILVGSVAYEHVFSGGGWLIPNIDSGLFQSIVGASRIGFGAGGVGARFRTLQDKSRETVSIEDYFRPDLGDTDYTQGFERAQSAVLLMGGGEVLCPGPSYMASRIVQRRFVVIRGRQIGATELIQTPGSNQDFIISENFYDLVGTGITAAQDARVPSFFGLANIRVNGNRGAAGVGNTSGRGICWYGPAPIAQGVVIVYNCAEDGGYSEYSNMSGSTGWQGQEEGQFDCVIPRNNGGNGWTFRGPHNSRIGNVIAGFNNGWGFRSESGPNYDGGIDWLSSLHTYANGRSTFPALDTGAYIGEIARIGTVIVDGDNFELAASNAQIAMLRAYNIGGARDGMVLSGNANSITSINANVWSGIPASAGPPAVAEQPSVGRVALRVPGSRNDIGNIQLTTNNPDNDGVVISGSSNKIGRGYVQGFSAAGRIGLNLGGTKNNVCLELTGNAISFNYQAGTNNKVDLEINTSAGQVPVAGSAPGVTDRFDIRASGTTAGGTRTEVQSGQIGMESTAAQTVTIAHGLLYPPTRAQCALTLLDSTPSSVLYQVAYMRVASTDATNVTVNFRLATGATAGSGALARIGLVGRN